MADSFVSRGFAGRRREPDGAEAGRVPPGQYVTRDFPVLSAGPTPRIDLADWQFTIDGLVRQPVSWSWDEIHALSTRDFTVDISCVTKWTKLDTRWTGVSVDTLLEQVELDPAARYVVAHSYGGYTTNLPLTDVLNGQAFVAWDHDGQPLEPAHGGPARLVVPHLYFWKSAKWLRGLRLLADDEPGFWESLGYHNRGDPWREERYSGD
ncbi:MAG TPA: sulfite oxidase-like oxidoreductase [Candidatus Limnocylindria bacterium]